MKTKKELNTQKEEVESLNKKLAELTDEELELVTGGRELSGGIKPPATTDDRYSGSERPAL